MEAEKHRTYLGNGEQLGVFRGEAANGVSNSEEVCQGTGSKFCVDSN